MKTRTRRLLTLLLIAAMTMSLMVPALAVNTAQSETPYTYDAGDYTFGKISHADKAPGTPDGIVDYTGDGTVAVTGTVTGADGQGDRLVDLLLGRLIQRAAEIALKVAHDGVLDPVHIVNSFHSDPPNSIPKCQIRLG